MMPASAPDRRRTGRQSDASHGAWKSFREGQFEFAAAILDPNRPVPPGVTGPDGKPSARRFAVYRNNVVVGLCDTLRAAFPVVRRLVGDEFFAAMARIYVSREPPDSPIMLHYGGGFPDFIAKFEPARDLPYLRDVARLERAWAESYHAAEARPLRPVEFTAISAEQVAGLCLQLHPSVRIVRSPFPILTIWRANIETGEPQAIDLDAGGEDVFVARPRAEVDVRLLPAGGAAFLEALGRGASILDAAEGALNVDRRFDLPGNIGGLLASEAIVRYRLVEEFDQPKGLPE